MVKIFPEQQEMGFRGRQMEVVLDDYGEKTMPGLIIGTIFHPGFQDVSGGK